MVWPLSKRVLTGEHCVINYRLSWAGMNVECSFDTLHSKCKVMDIALRCIFKIVDKINNCICTFPSFVRIKEEKMSQPLTVENNSVLMSPQFQTLFCQFGQLCSFPIDMCHALYVCDIPCESPLTVITHCSGQDTTRLIYGLDLERIGCEGMDKVYLGY